MKRILPALLAIGSLIEIHAAELNLPLLPAEAKIIQGIAATEGVEVVLASKPGFSARGAADTLASLGVAKNDIASVTVQSNVLAITGNGPWLRNSTPGEAQRGGGGVEEVTAIHGECGKNDHEPR